MRKGKLTNHSFFTPEEGAPPPLTARTTRRVRFEELDPLRIVWHGRYVSYFEDGRVAFGRKYGLSYERFMEHRLAAPIVRLHIDYLAPLTFDERITIEATLHWCTALRLNFEFNVFRESGEQAAAGSTVQVLTDLDGTLLFVAPDWIEEFRQRWRAGRLTGLPDFD
ncbi:MAG: acyl-CoA thioesterase [Desulfobulbaceae bacterium]